jgi:hypothetical protein
VAGNQRHRAGDRARDTRRDSRRRGSAKRARQQRRKRRRLGERGHAVPLDPRPCFAQPLSVVHLRKRPRDAHQLPVPGVDRNGNGARLAA